MFLENGKLIFDRENCENCVQEAISWDEEDHYNKVLKTYGTKYNHIESMNVHYSKNYKGWIAHPNTRLCKNPAKERLYKRRKGDKRTTGHYAHKENYNHTRETKRRFRQKMKHSLYNEEFYNIRPRDHKTYGWETW